MNEKTYGFVCCVRPSTESIVLLSIPFYFVKESQDDQLKISAYCGDELGASGFIPLLISDEPVIDEEKWLQEIRKRLFQNGWRNSLPCNDLGAAGRPPLT